MQCYLPPFSSFSLTHSLPAPDLGAYHRDMEARDLGSSHSLHARAPRLAHSSLFPLLHTQGIKQESIQGTVPTA